jgi:hypothetical protein
MNRKSKRCGAAQRADGWCKVGVGVHVEWAWEPRHELPLGQCSPRRRRHRYLGAEYRVVTPYLLSARWPRGWAKKGGTARAIASRPFVDEGLFDSLLSEENHHGSREVFAR